MLGFKSKKKEQKEKYRLINLDEFNKEQQAKIQQLLMAEKRKIAWNLLNPRQQEAMKKIIAEKRIRDAKQKRR